MNILIKNVPDTSDLEPPYPYKTWIEYWESKKGAIPILMKYNCPAIGCTEECYRSDFDGCHVQKVADITKKMYIIPLCSRCNHRNDYFFVDENLLVPAP